MNRRIKTKSIVLGLSMALTASLAIADTFNATQVENLRKQGKAQQAYELALKYRDQLEGNPVYDLYYGLAAIDSGKLSEGVLALERVVSINPGNLRARLELARGYFLLREDVRARQEFETVLKKNPPAQVVNNIRPYLRLIRLRESQYRSTGGAYVEFGLGHDTNINSATAGNSFFSPLFGVLNFADSSREISDDFFRVTAGGKLVHPFEVGKQLVLGLDVSGRYNSDSDNDAFDSELWNAYVNVSWREGKNLFAVSGQLQEYELDDLDNRSLFSLSGEWSHEIDKQTNWISQLQVAQLDYPDASLRNSTLYVLGTGLTHQYTTAWRPAVSASVYLGYESAHSDTDAGHANAERNYGGIRLAGQVIPTSNTSISASVSAETGHYDAENIFTGKTRNDDLYQAALTGRYLVDDNWSLGAGVYYTRQDSNTTLNDYDRTVTEITARYTF